MTSWKDAIDMYRKERDLAQERKRVRDEKYWEDLEKAFEDINKQLKENPPKG